MNILKSGARSANIIENIIHLACSFREYVVIIAGFNNLVSNKMSSLTSSYYPNYDTVYAHISTLSLYNLSEVSRAY